jgi:phage terminase small subunit
MPLPPKQQRFCEEYIKHLNSAEAARAAGSPERSAGQRGYELLGKPEVQAEIQRLMKERGDRVRFDQDRILREIRYIALSDLRKLFREDGTMKHPHQWPKYVARAVASFEVVEEFEGSGRDRVHVGYTKKVKFWDKTKAIELGGRHLGMFSQDDDAKKKPTDTSTLAASLAEQLDKLVREKELIHAARPANPDKAESAPADALGLLPAKA